jgi:electron transfer flavoprotein beta subunit
MSNDATQPLRVLVTVKQVLDPEAPPALLRAHPDTHEVSGRGVAPRLDPYSMHALQAALVLREQCAAERAVEIHVVGIGPSPSRNLYLRALASGADRVSLLDTASDPVTFGDSWATADRLARLVRHVRPDGWDLVLTGRRGADTNTGAVGAALARLLDVPVVTLATALRVEQSEGGPRVLVDQLADSGSNLLSAPLPAVVTVSHEVGEAPVVPFARMVEAKKMPLDILVPADLDGTESTGAPATTYALVGMQERDEHRTCELVEGSDAREAGRALARRLLELTA